MEVFCELGNGVSVMANRALGEVPQPEVLQHTLA